MKWRNRDLAQYVKAKEYIDTAMIPLIPFQLVNDQGMETDSFQSEVLSLLSNEMEKELSGRILLTPNYNYIRAANMEMEKDRLNMWVKDIQKQPFKHIFFLAFDSKWKKMEKELDGTLIWLPGVQTGELQSKEMQQMLRDQVSQIGELIRSYW
ncbi:YpiF family protein [Oceanobacillus salinisoli]|uniref:YpiF family protein n=1 Tax=Oceanobacillus salinisoli TaxID=2678611 RepID=UPI0012E2A032|nr:YpiF family protein [Oceanobacillus salinisoli]